MLTMLRLVASAALSGAVVSGCMVGMHEDGWTDVYVANESMVGYVIGFVHRGEPGESFWRVGPESRGMTLNIRGKAPGTVVLYDERCQQLDEHVFDGGRIAVTIRDHLLVNPRPRPVETTTMGGSFSWSETCPGAKSN